MTTNARESQMIPVRPEDSDDETKEVPETRKKIRTTHKTTPKERVMKQDKPIPTEGWPAYKYALDQFISKGISFYDPEIPDMNKTERERYEFGLQLARIEALIERLQFLTVENERIIAILNSKGGAGKTPILCYLACILKDLTGEPVVFIDANENVGTAHRWFGIRRNETLLLQEAVIERLSLTTYNKIARRAAKHLKTATRFIGSNRKRDKQFDANDFVEMVTIVNEAFHTTFVDTGNGFDSQSNMGAVEVANALLFPILANKPDTYDGLAESMKNYIDEGYKSKVHNGFVIVNGTSPSDTKEKYLDIIQAELNEHPVPTYNEVTRITRNVLPTLEDFGIEPDRLFLIPYSEYIAAPQINVITADPGLIGFDTYEAMVALLVEIFEQNAIYHSEESSSSASAEDIPHFASTARVADVTNQ